MREKKRRKGELEKWNRRRRRGREEGKKRMRRIV